MYEIVPSKKFDKLYQKIIRKNRWLEARYLKTIKRMKNNPFDPALNTHKAISKHFDEANSSKVTGDLRIIWKFDVINNKIILLLTTGGHSGGNAVY